MIDAIGSVLRVALAAIGLLALADPAATTGSLAAAAVILLAVTVLVVAATAATTATGRGAAPRHPTRRIELSAPLSQSDPDAAGHVRRRGPGQAASAA